MNDTPLNDRFVQHLLDAEHDLWLPSGRRYERTLRAAEHRLFGKEPTTFQVETQDDVTEAWAEKWHRRVAKKRDVVVFGYGKTGSGKSMGTLHFCRKLDPTFTLSTMGSRIAFRPEQVIDTILNAGPGEVYWIDEGGTAGFGSTDTMNPIQRELRQAFMETRALRRIGFFLCPDPEEMALFMRGRRATYAMAYNRDNDDQHAPYAYIGEEVRPEIVSELGDGRTMPFFYDLDQRTPYTWPNYEESTADPEGRAMWEWYLDHSMTEKTDDLKSRSAKIHALVEKARGTTEKAHAPRKAKRD